MLEQACRDVLVQGGVNFLGQIRLIWSVWEVTGAQPSGTEISKGIREQGPNSVLDLEKTSAESQRTSPSCSIANGVQVWAVKVKLNRSQM